MLLQTFYSPPPPLEYDFYDKRVKISAFNAFSFFFLFETSTWILIRSYLILRTSTIKERFVKCVLTSYNTNVNVKMYSVFVHVCSVFVHLRLVFLHVNSLSTVLVHVQIGNHTNELDVSTCKHRQYLCMSAIFVHRHVV